MSYSALFRGGPLDGQVKWVDRAYPMFEAPGIRSPSLPTPDQPSQWITQVIDYYDLIEAVEVGVGGKERLTFLTYKHLPKE